MKEFSIRDIVRIGMLAALCIVATMIKIPYGHGAMVHLGTAAIFTFAILFGGVYAGLAGAIGSAFF
ncbi:MAG: ECF transporter S component [Clostridia bacterium]